MSEVFNILIKLCKDNTVHLLVNYQIGLRKAQNEKHKASHSSIIFRQSVRVLQCVRASPSNSSVTFHFCPSRSLRTIGVQNTLLAILCDKAMTVWSLHIAKLTLQSKLYVVNVTGKSHEFIFIDCEVSLLLKDKIDVAENSVGGKKKNAASNTTRHNMQK